MSLKRFHDAQDSRSAGYEAAVAEIRRGQKTSHWIWYIFPQLAGLGQSATARAYGLAGFAEARSYLCDPVLCSRYEEITKVVDNQLAAGRSVEELMGGTIDALKLVSSLTLFRAAAQSLLGKDAGLEGLMQHCDSILRETTRQGYPPCARTLSQIS